MASKPIPWEYCECGCKSSTVTIGGAYFSFYNDLQGGYWFATSHHPRLMGVRLDSMRAVNQKVRTALKARKIEVQRELSELEDL